LSNYARKHDDSKSIPNNIIPFPQPNNSSTSEPGVGSLLSHALRNPEVEGRLKEIMEAAVFNAWANTRLLDIERADGPFDPIYISELRADPIVSDDIKQIQMYADIIDLSNTINFEDGWED
jgi:hypothetical protein